MGVGLVAGGSTYYALRTTVEYWDKLQERFKSQPLVHQLLDSGLYVWTLLLIIIAAALMAFFSTKFIVQQMAG